MEVRLIMVPPGGGEADYSLDFVLSEVPRAGEVITVSRGEKYGLETFLVRSVWWEFNFPEGAAVHYAGNEPKGKLIKVNIECEFARGPHMSEDHKKACDMYEARGKAVTTLDDTMY